MLQDREYQNKAVAELSKRFKARQRIVAVAPTGSGKTVIAAQFLKRNKGKRVLWVAHRIELLRQAYDQLKAAGIPKEELGILSGPDKRNTTARILVVSVDMFRFLDLPDADIIVVDEAHRIMAKSYRDLIDARPNALVLGFTATPERLDGKPLGDVFQDMYVMAETIDLIAGKFIVQPACYGVSKSKARAILKGVAGGKDYAVDALGKAMSKRALMGDIVTECARLAPGQRTIVFAVNREHGKKLLSRFKKAKRLVEYVDGETPSKDREQIIARLESGETEVVVNVDVLSEGFDCPPVKCIALARPTKSLTRFLQQIGRASRPYKNLKPIILDHAGNCWRFGLPEMPREWSLDGRPKDGQPPLWHCKECQALNEMKDASCWVCGAERPMSEREEKEIQEKETELARLRATEAEREAAMGRIRALAKEKGANDEWVAQVAKAMGI